jgi:hypothetical protein
MTTKPKWHRLQILLDPEQMRALKARAAQQRVSMGAFLRQAVDHELRRPTLEERLAAAERLCNGNFPVGDWADMKRELLEGLAEPHGYDPSVLGPPKTLHQ